MPRICPVAAVRSVTLLRSHPVILGVVLELDQPQFLQEWRKVHAETAAQTLLQTIPATHRIRWRPAPGLDRALFRRLLLVGAAELHPVAALLQHRVQVVDAAKII